MQNNYSEIRTDIRAIRRDLSHSQLEQNSSLIFNAIRQAINLKKLNHVALYFSEQGEVSCDLLLEYLLAQKCAVYFPCVNANKEMEFRRYCGSEKIQLNRYKIREPDPTCPVIETEKLDMVFVPLVAFDRHCHRIGMGGGYYDRSFAFRLNKPAVNEPTLVGLAHSFQEIASIQAEEWDVPLDEVFTETQRFTRLPSHVAAR